MVHHCNYLCSAEAIAVRIVNVLETLATTPAVIDIASFHKRVVWPLSRILAFQGHDMNTSMKHYYNNDVTPEERINIKEMTQGWG
jgi:hypothetical protein